MKKSKMFEYTNGWGRQCGMIITSHEPEKPIRGPYMCKCIGPKLCTNSRCELKRKKK